MPARVVELVPQCIAPTAPLWLAVRMPVDGQGACPKREVGSALSRELTGRDSLLTMCMGGHQGFAQRVLCVEGKSLRRRRGG